MNLGDSNLRHVNTSRPQLVHSTSQQSVTASDDYFSLNSDYGSSGDERTNGARYGTPPMLVNGHAQEAQQSEATIPTIRAVKDKPVKESQITEEEPIIMEAKKPAEHMKTVSAASSRGTVVHRPVGTGAISPPTPGVDDTPYIQFAIDQLTRDEEVMGSRRESTAVPLTDGPQKRPEAGSKGMGLKEFLQTTSPPPEPPPKERNRSPNSENVLLPAEPAAPTFKYPKLQYAPAPLTALSLGSFILCCLLMMAGLAFSAVWPMHHIGLYDYDGAGTSRYFVFEFLPQILAAILILWLVTIQYALYRTYPFVVLASGQGYGNSGVLYDARLFPTNYLIPNLSYLRHGGPWLTLWTLTSWLALFTVPLQSCLFQTRYFSDVQLWRWTTVTPVAWALFGIYGLLVLGLAALLLRFTFGSTGLKWDPTSLADIMAIFYRSNILNDFQRTEIKRTVSCPPKDIRLGYWRTSQANDDLFYCIGDENAPIRRYSLEKGKMRPLNEQPPHLDIEAQRLPRNIYNNFRGDIHDASSRYRSIPWFLSDSSVVAWIVIGFVLLIAFLVVSFVRHAVQDGFSPRLPAPTTSRGFSPADFVFSFIPSLLGMLMFLLWQPLDAYFRALQPFESLADPEGSPADQSILLDYLGGLPLAVSCRALIHGHYKVAWISFIGTVSIIIPILAGGVFTAQYVTASQEVLTVASMPAFEALAALVTIYVLSLLCLFPTKQRYLPHDISTLGELVSFFYQSPILGEEAFKEPASKIDMVTKLLAYSSDEKLSPRFAFGIYVGQDGREHLGIDRVERPGYEMTVV